MTLLAPLHGLHGRFFGGAQRGTRGDSHGRCVSGLLGSEFNVTNGTVTALSAAGAVEAVFSLMTMREGVLPPTINYDHPDPAIELDVVPNVKRNADVKAVLSNSFGFGGQNACLVMAREPN